MSPRRVLRGLLLLVGTLLLASAAWAYFSATSSPGGGGAAVAATVGAGAAPTTSGARGSVAVSWAASTLSSGRAVDGYRVTRYDVTTSVGQPAGNGCSGIVAATTCTESGVPDGSWAYTVTPVVAQQWTGAESARSAVVATDSTAPTHVVSLSGVTGGATLAGTTLYYRGAAAGSFTLTDSVTDARSGPASSTTDALGGTTTGWTHTASTVSTPTGGPYVSTPFTWGSATTSQPTDAVTARDVAGNTAVTSLSFVDDSTAPSGDAVSYADGASASSTVSVALTNGTDAGSGVASRVLQRASATRTGMTCGSFGSFATIATSPTSPYSDTLTAGSCYAYRYVVTDNVGNTEVATSPSVVRTSDGADWDFEEGAGSTAADSTGNGNTATLQSGAGWATGTVHAKALALTGSGNSWASSAGPVVDTSRSFTVATWVKLNNLSGFQTFAGMDGSSVTPFYLQARDNSSFTFETYGSDSTSGSSAGASGGTPATGVWFHVAGVYDDAAHTATLYVNGTSQAVANGASTFRASGATTIGRGKYGGSPVDFLNGSVDDVRFYDRALTGSQVATLAGMGGAGPTGGSVDATGLTGTGSRYATSTTLSLAPAKGTDPDGVATSGNVLSRASASLTSGTCGAYGGYAQVASDPSSPYSDSVTDGACYRYQYRVLDAQGNATTYTSPDIKVDSTAPSAPTLAFSGLTNAYGSGSTLYYNPASTGSFTLSGSATDGQSGVASYGFPSLGTGWTSTPGASGVNTYSWTASPTAPGARSVTATNNASLTSAGAVLNPTADSTAPTGDAISYADGATSSTTVGVTLTTGTDAASGVGTRLLQRASATRTGMTCGSFGSFSTIATNPSSPYSDTIAAGSCYQYRYVVLDNVGNTDTATSSSVVRTSDGAQWGFEEGAGSTAADGTGNGSTMTLQSGAGWGTGTIGAKSLALTGAGDSWASTAGPVVDSSKSFTVAAWVKLNNLNGFQTFASMDGSSVTPFYLQSRNNGSFVFETYGSDATSGSTALASGGTPVTGVWIHVAGVYDAVAHTATLYVNGTSQSSVNGASTFRATGSTIVGRGKYGGGIGDFTNGSIDDVRFFDRALSASDISTLAGH